jgi:hypothetical protein
MNRCLVLASLLALPSVASAQVHSGVALSSILAPNERVLAVEAPDAWELPARVRIACDATSAACARIDVWVAETEADATARYAAATATSSSTALVPRHDVGEVAMADSVESGAVLVIARRDNVVFRVQVLASTSAEVIAARIDAAVIAAPVGDARATRADPDGALGDPAEGTTIVVQPPTGILAVDVTATGDSAARRVSGGWSLTRGTGAFELFAWVVDDQLRVGNLSISWDPDSHEDRR